MAVSSAIDTKTRESRARRAAARKGWKLEKSRVRPAGEHMNNQGGWRIIDASSNFVVGGANYDLGLDQVESWVQP